MQLAIALILSLTTGTSGLKTESSVVRQAPVENANGGDMKLICKTEAMTGSRTKRKRTCLSREEWRFRAEQANDALNGASRDY